MIYINDLNNIINNDSSTININAAHRINFKVNNTQLTKIDTTGLVIYHPALETFPYNYDWWYIIGDRFNTLFHVMSDTLHSIINYDATHNTVIRISEQDIVNQIYYPRHIQFQTYQGPTFSKFDTQGLQLLDKYNNWYYINNYSQLLIIVPYYVVIKWWLILMEIYKYILLLLIHG